jgi:hypothetical protein
MMPLEDMSGCNDAFNSSIVSLNIKARYSNMPKYLNRYWEVSLLLHNKNCWFLSFCNFVVLFNPFFRYNKTEGTSTSEVEEEFHFVIKSPPKSHFIRLMHKFTR